MADIRISWEHDCPGIVDTEEFRLYEKFNPYYQLIWIGSELSFEDFGYKTGDQHYRICAVEDREDWSYDGIDGLNFACTDFTFSFPGASSDMSFQQKLNVGKRYP